jgi:putative ABC transport system permease protein
MIGFQQLQRRTPLGWLQLSHQKGKLVVACAGVVFADVLMLMQLGFQGALFNSAVLVHNSVRADVVLLSPQARNLSNMSSFPRRRLYQSMDIPGRSVCGSAVRQHGELEASDHPARNEYADVRI